MRQNRIALLTALALGLGAVPAGAAASGSLAGTWRGTIADSAHRQTITLSVNARQTGGTWSLGPTCHGTLTLDSMSNGYHHYLRHLARGARCAFGGEIDCLERSGAGVEDAITTHLGGAWGLSGTLRRVR